VKSLTRGSRDFFSTFGGQVGAILVALLTQAMLARALEPSGRGSLYICQVFQSTLAIIFAVGCDTAALYYVSSRRFSLSEGITYTLVNGTVSSILAVIAGWLLISCNFEIFAKASEAEFRLALFLVPITLFSLVFQGLLTAVGRYGAFGAATLLRAVSLVVLVFLLVWLGGWGVAGSLWANIIAYLVSLLFSLHVLVNREGARLVKPRLDKIATMWSYGARYYLGKLSNTANLQIGPILLGFLVSKEQLGFFSIAYRLLDQVESIPHALATLLLPRVSLSVHGRKELVARIARLALAVCGFILALLAVFAVPLVRIVFSDQFLPAVPVVRILCLAAAFRTLTKVYAPYLLGRDHPGFTSLAMGAGGAGNLLLILLLVPAFGVAGAAAGMAIGYLISTCILIFGFCRFSGLSLRDAFTWTWDDFRELKHLSRALGIGRRTP